MSAHDPRAALDRVLQEVRRNIEALADEVRAIGPGSIVRTRGLPLVWTLNQLRIGAPAAFTDIVALADEHQADLPYRHVVVDDDATARQVADEFAHAGWTVEREVIMTLTEDADRVVDAQAVIELSEEQMLSLMRRWAVEDYPDISGAGLEQLAEYNRREGNLWAERRFGVTGDDGSALAVTKLRTSGATTWVEDVYTVPEARGHGFARMLVTHATERARHAGGDLVFILADDDDWPKELYARIGFRPVGRAHVFHRAVGRDR